MRSAILLLLFMFLNVLLSAQSDLITVTPKEWDFGTILDHKPVHHIFSIQNHSDKKVKLNNLPTPCGCVAFEPKPDVISPGQEAKVHVEFNPRGKRGKCRWEVEIGTDLKQVSKITIPISANVLRDTMFSEDSVNFRIIKRDQQKDFILWFTCRQHKNFKINALTCSSEDFGVQYEETQVQGFYPGPQRGYKIIVTPRKNIPLGRHNEQLQIVTNIPEKEKINVQIWAYVTGDLVTAPDYVSFGLVIPGKIKKRPVKIYHKNLNKFRVEKVESSLAFVTTKVEAKIPDEYYYVWIILNCPDDLAAGEFRGTVNIYTDYPTHKIAPVHIQGFVRGKQKNEKK